MQDVVDAYLLLAEKSELIKPGSAYNFSNDKAYSVIDIYREICEVAIGKFIKPRYLITATNEIHDQHLSSAKALTEFGWKSSHTLKLGLEQESKWYKEIIAQSKRAFG